MLCPDDLMVTVSDGLMTVFYSPNLGLQPKAALVMLWDVLTLFWNLLCAVLTAGSIFEQVRQSPEANSKSESAVFFLNSSWVDSSPS